MARISFHEVSETNWRATLRLAVHPDQQQFVADAVPIAAIVLAKAYIRPGGLRWVPYVIAAEGEFIGMIALADGSTRSETSWIYHFFIDKEYQGKGYGKAALRAFIVLVREQYPQCSQLSLTVHPANTRGQHLYASTGFRPTGAQQHGELVYILDLRDELLGA